MEKLAIGLTIICLLYFVLFFCLAFLLDDLAEDREDHGRMHRVRITTQAMLRRLMNRFPNNQSKKAA